MPAPRRALGRVFRFHLRLGARVALAAMVAATAAAAGVLMFLRVDFLLNLAQQLFGARGRAAPALLVLGAAVAVAAVAAPRASIPQEVEEEEATSTISCGPGP